jgi:hypothetical protein
MSHVAHPLTLCREVAVGSSKWRPSRKHHGSKEIFLARYSITPVTCQLNEAAAALELTSEMKRSPGPNAATGTSASTNR